MHLKDLNWCKLKFITDILFIYVFSILGFIRVSMGLRIWVSDHCSIGSITWEPSIEYLHILLNVNRKVANLDNLRNYGTCVVYQDFFDIGLPLKRNIQHQVFPSLRLKSHHFERFPVAIITWLTATDCLCHWWPRTSSFHRRQITSCLRSWPITYFLIRITRQCH